MNGFNAINAHAQRAGDDTIFTRELIESYTFLGFGTVVSYLNERIKVSCGAFTYTNVEVMVFGVDGWGIKPVPAVGDRVMLFTTKTPVPDIKDFAASGTMPAYDPSGLKAIPVTDSTKAKQLITVDKNGVVLTGDNKVTINAAGISVEDKNGNKISTSNAGVEFIDTNNNKVTTSSSGVEFVDANNNKVTTSSSGVEFVDANNNKVTTSSSGISIEDKGGCTFVSDGSSTKINGKLEIKKG